MLLQTIEAKIAPRIYQETTYCLTIAEQRGKKDKRKQKKRILLNYLLYYVLYNAQCIKIISENIILSIDMCFDDFSDFNIKAQVLMKSSTWFLNFENNLSKRNCIRIRILNQKELHHIVYCKTSMYSLN